MISITLLASQCNQVWECDKPGQRAAAPAIDEHTGVHQHRGGEGVEATVAKRVVDKQESCHNAEHMSSCGRKRETGGMALASRYWHR